MEITITFVFSGNNKNLDPVFDPTCFSFPWFCISQSRKSWAEAPGCLQVFRKRWHVAPATLPRFPHIVSVFVREHAEMRGCFIFFIFFFFSSQVWCWMEAAALFRRWWGGKTQLRVNTLLVFIHKYEAVQEHQTHMERCDWLLLMSYWCHSTQKMNRLAFLICMYKFNFTITHF